MHCWDFCGPSRRSRMAWLLSVLATTSCATTKLAGSGTPPKTTVSLATPAHDRWYSVQQDDLASTPTAVTARWELARSGYSFGLSLVLRSETPLALDVRAAEFAYPFMPTDSDEVWASWASELEREPIRSHLSVFVFRDDETVPLRPACLPKSKAAQRTLALGPSEARVFSGRLECLGSLTNLAETHETVVLRIHASYRASTARAGVLESLTARHRITVYAW